MALSTERTPQKQSPRQAILADLVTAARERGLVLLAGAGVSCSARLPTWNDLLKALLRPILTSTAFQQFQQLGKLDDAAPVVGRLIRDQLGEQLEESIRAELLDALIPGHDLRTGLPTSKQLRPRIRSRLLIAIAELAQVKLSSRRVVRAIVTYNYDNLVEETLEGVKVPHVAVRSVRQKVQKTDLPFYHVHGWLPLTSESELKAKEEVAVDAVSFLDRQARNVFLRIWDGESIADLAGFMKRPPERVQEQYDFALEPPARICI